MRKNPVVIVLLVLSVLSLLTACAQTAEPQPSEPAATEAAAVTEAEAVAETEAAAEEQPAAEGIAWPAEMPAEVPVLEGVTLTYFHASQSGLPTKSVQFEGDDKAVIEAYIEKLTAAGFKETDRSEDNFSLNYTCEKETLRVFINFVSGSTSHIDAIQMP